jgi:hypothetical protein
MTIPIITQFSGTTPWTWLDLSFGSKTQLEIGLEENFFI